MLTSGSVWARAPSTPTTISTAPAPASVYPALFESVMAVCSFGSVSFTFNSGANPRVILWDVLEPKRNRTGKVGVVCHIAVELTSCR